MKIHSVYDPEFAPYGKVIQGGKEECAEILRVLESTPLPDNVIYVAEEPALQKLPAAKFFSEHLYGGMPIQMGYCNGHNRTLNCLEYHRDSEFNLGCEDFILLLAKQEEIQKNTLDTACVKAFLVPAGVLVECYATTLHYAPCHTNDEKGFRVLIALPQGTNTAKPPLEKEISQEDKLLFARNKWLLAHATAPEVKDGAFVGLIGKNLSLA